jgi:hypothetical protein
MKKRQRREVRSRQPCARETLVCCSATVQSNTVTTGCGARVRASSAGLRVQPFRLAKQQPVAHRHVDYLSRHVNIHSAIVANTVAVRKLKLVHLTSLEKHGGDLWSKAASTQSKLHAPNLLQARISSAIIFSPASYQSVDGSVAPTEHIDPTGSTDGLQVRLDLQDMMYAARCGDIIPSRY